MRMRLLIALVFCPALALAQTAAKPVRKLDFRFKSQGRVYHVLQPIDEGKDAAIDAPVTSDDKSSTVMLHLRASLRAGDGSRAPLLYQATLRGAGDVVLLQSQGVVYVVPGTYSDVAQCADWTMNLGLWTGQKAFMRVGTGDDLLWFTADSPGAQQKCRAHVKPGSTALVAAQMLGADGRPHLFSFKATPAERPQLDGLYNVGYDVSFPGLAMTGVASMHQRKSRVIKQGDRAVTIGLGSDE